MPPSDSSVMSCFVMREETRQEDAALSYSSFVVAFIQIELAVDGAFVSPFHAPVPTTERVFHGVEVATPTLPEVSIVIPVGLASVRI